ncbi:cytochrome P450 3A5 [Galendromus occidentalis]|uniref:Cytochrome P450 3A5 n=1 Tax=Galendromus occidentalis TaxID=34638 RepID=A0AAJ7SIN2_9ACAR|nr:cytochrome P450 3A5 [Galendromus occidentalis]
MFHLLPIIVLVLLLIYILKKRHDGMQFFKRFNIPGPKPSILSGNLWEIYKRGHMVMQREWHAEFGPIVGYFFGPLPILLISDQELLKTILLRDFHDFADRPVSLERLSDLMGPPKGTGFDESLILLRGQRWKDVRSTLTPSFTSKKLKQIAPEMCTSVDLFMENVGSCFIEGKECDIYELLQALTLDTICRVGMGVDFGVQKDVANSKLLKQVKIMTSFPLTFMALILYSLVDVAAILLSIFLRLKNSRENSGSDPITALKKQCSTIVKQRREKPELRRNDLLQLMIDAQMREAPTNIDALIAGDEADENREGENTTAVPGKISACPFSGEGSRGLTDGEVIDNAFLVLLAGYETTSSALAFITKLLLRFPEVQERVRCELLEATAQGKEFDFDRLQRCQYLEAVVQESLRLYPPVYFFTMRACAVQKVYGSITIPKDARIAVSVRELHYDPDVFEDPHDFKPERFLPENKTSAMSWAWQPFGAGPRNCIGMRFAQMEIKITLAKLLSQYRLSSDREPYHDPNIATNVLPNLQRVKDPLSCKLEKL